MQYHGFSSGQAYGVGSCDLPCQKLLLDQVELGLYTDYCEYLKKTLLRRLKEHSYPFFL